MSVVDRTTLPTIVLRVRLTSAGRAAAKRLSARRQKKLASMLERTAGTKLTVTYSDVPDGGRITYTSNDPTVIDASTNSAWPNPWTTATTDPPGEFVALGRGPGTQWKLIQYPLSDYGSVMSTAGLEQRAALHAAVGDPMRLAIVDELTVSDRAPVELVARLGVTSNLLAHHLDVLEAVGLVSRSRSSGDGRRRYVHLNVGVLQKLGGRPRVRARRALFVCTDNSARSQLAAVLWSQLTDQPAISAGTHPASRVHRGAVAAARRAGLDLTDARPHCLDDLVEMPDLVVTVCDRAHEELDAPTDWLHWSVPDPVPVASRAAFDAAVDELRRRMTTITEGISL